MSADMPAVRGTDTTTASLPDSRAQAGLKLVARVAVWAIVILVALVIYELFIDDDERASLPTTELPPATVLYAAEADQATVIARAEQALRDADRATAMANQVLSFLEGASVLVALALGAAAIYGFRNAQEVRRDLREEIEEIKIMRGEMERYGDHLRLLPERMDRLDAMEATVTDALRDMQPVFVALLQSNHELQLRNYEMAYAAVMRALERDPDNPMALYIAGWLEFQYIPGQQERGAEHLRQALKVQPDWPSAMAAYGVVLRRQAMRATGSRRDDLFNQAEGHLRQALGLNPNLIDLNRESLWGPVAGILRDTGKFDRAIEAYEQACRVTPGSSYPRGNLAALYLRRGNDDPDSPWRKKALETFSRTEKAAEAELSLVPNDYFHVMDLAMSRMVLGQDDPAMFDFAFETLNDALDMRPAPEMLGVSRRGWQNLLDYSPQDWTTLRENLRRAANQIDRALAEAQAAQAEK